MLLFHELGHLCAAIACGMRVSELLVSVGPKLAGFHARGTDWSLRLLPVAAFVRIAGMDDRRDAHPHPSWSYRAKPALSRAAVVVEGPVANLLLGALLLVAA